MPEGVSRLNLSGIGNYNKVHVDKKVVSSSSKRWTLQIPKNNRSLEPSNLPSKNLSKLSEKSESKMSLSFMGKSLKLQNKVSLAQHELE